MNWKAKYEHRISSESITPKIGMRVKAIKTIDGASSIIGITGTIIKVNNGHYLPICCSWDDVFKGAYSQSIHNYVRYATKTDWDEGHLEILGE